MNNQQENLMAHAPASQGMKTLLAKLEPSSGSKESKLFESLCSYLFERYYKEIFLVLASDEMSIYYDITIDLIELIYHFPKFGSVFYLMPNEFIDTLRCALVEC